ncbi:MAG: class I SAM-dependent methyltransferase [archaeon]
MKLCEICQKPDVTLLKTAAKFNLMKCGSCGFIYKDTLEYNYEGLSEDDYIMYNFNRRNEALELNKIIEKFAAKESPRILEIGSGTGSLLKELSSLGYNVTGVEPSKAAVNISGESFPDIRVINDYFSASLIKEESDVILLNDVIEHLSPANRLFQEIADYMKPETILIVKSGNPHSLNAKLFLEKWVYVLGEQHISFYSPRALEAFCKKWDLKLIKYYKFRHAYGGINLSKLLVNLKRAVFIRTGIGSLLGRDYSIELANDHFIAVIKKMPDRI